VLHDDAAANLERQLGRQQRDSASPYRVPGTRGTDRVQEAADHDRRDGDRRKDLGATVDQPGELVRVTARSVARWDNRGARSSGPAPWS
jgi:hypothetical protein